MPPPHVINPSYDDVVEIAQRLRSPIVHAAGEALLAKSPAIELAAWSVPAQPQVVF
jgi:hypothetical protein